MGAHCRLIRRDGSELTGPSSALIEEEEELTCVVSSVEPWLKMLGLLHEDGTAFSESWLFKQRMWWEVGGTDDLLRHRMGKRCAFSFQVTAFLPDLTKPRLIGKSVKKLFGPLRGPFLTSGRRIGRIVVLFQIGAFGAWFGSRRSKKR